MLEIQPHLRTQTGDLGSRVLFLRTPAAVAEVGALLTDATEIARNRGFVTLNGGFNDVPVSLISVGLGGPSVSIALEEAIAAGGRAFVHLDTAWQTPNLTTELLLASAAIRDDGTSLEYFPVELPAVADLGLLRHARAVLAANAAPVSVGSVLTTDRIYPPELSANRLRVTPQVPCDLTTGLLYTLSRARGVSALALLLKTDLGAFARGLDSMQLTRWAPLALAALTEVDVPTGNTLVHTEPATT